MYLSFALDYIPRRMRELGFGENYAIRYRQIYIADSDTIKIEGENQLWIFIEPEGVLKIESQRGVYDMTDTAINIQQHEHAGKFTVTNNSGRAVHALFIQAIPGNLKKVKK